MTARGLAEHLEHPVGRGPAPECAHSGAAGGAACGDLVRVSVRVEGDRVAAASFDASGCGAAVAAGSAAVSLVAGCGVLAGARVGAREITAELAGLSPGKLHAAELAADALHRALGAAARAGAALTPAPERTLVAMSGGVDSAVAALLVARAGREPVAVTLELWSEPPVPGGSAAVEPAALGGSPPVAPRAPGGFPPIAPHAPGGFPPIAPPDTGGSPPVASPLAGGVPAHDPEASCCSAHAVRVARAVAHRMGLPHLTLDLRAEFRAGVVDPFLAEHAAGLTPNPCVRCNGHVRLDAMLDLARRLGAADLATGHYARHGAEGLLRAAADPGKDQSYMLAALAPASLARMRFPLGELTKPQVRALARAAGLPVADRRESQDLCFLAGTGKRAFLARHGGLGERAGAIVDGGGRRVGAHPGQHLFTVGQRKGLNVAAGEPLYVLAKDASANTVTVGPADALATRRVPVRAAVLHRPGAAVDRVRLRYRAAPVACRVTGAPAPGAHPRLELELDEPVAGAAPGQAACLLAGDVVVGWGWIST